MKFKVCSKPSKLGNGYYRAKVSSSSREKAVGTPSIRRLWRHRSRKRAVSLPIHHPSPNRLVFSNAKLYRARKPDHATTKGRMSKTRIAFACLLIALFATVCYAWFFKAGTSQSLHLLVANTNSDQSSQDPVLATYKLLEKAVQTGDAKLYLSLQSQKKLARTNQESLRAFQETFTANPSVHYEVVGVRTREDHAAVLGKITDASTPTQYYLVKFAVENGSWKIAEDTTNSRPIATAALEAAVPPKDGAFLRAGVPWDKIPPAVANTKWFKEDDIPWGMKASEDESFLYIRFEARAPLPAPGTEIAAEDAKSFKGIPSTPNVIVIKNTAGKEFQLQVADNPMTRATFDANGHATSNRYFMSYSMALRDSRREMLFSDGTEDTFAPLIAVQDRFIDIKLPLNSLGAETAGAAIEIREANSLAKLLPYQVSRFAQ